MQGKNRHPLGFNEYFEERGQHLLLPYESENSGCKQPGLVSPVLPRAQQQHLSVLVGNLRDPVLRCFGASVEHMLWE